MKNIEFVEAMYYFCKDTSQLDLNINKFVKYVRNDLKQFPNLNTYFKSHNLSLNYALSNPTELTNNI